MDRHGRILGPWAIVGGRYEVYEIAFCRQTGVSLVKEYRAGLRLGRH
jgi:hypothetical protein